MKRNYVLFGKVGEDFDSETLTQFQKAVSIPPVIRGALMPDGHVGYSIPIGGVVLMDNAVSPAYVGLDIGCSVMLTVLHNTAAEFLKNRSQYIKALREATVMGVGGRSTITESQIMEDNPDWMDLPVLRSNRDLAISQLGTSGGGNHFADILIFTPVKDSQHFLSDGAPCIALMTHSGSRGTGNKVATHYIEQSNQIRPKGIEKDYGWLELDTDLGQEYMRAHRALVDYAWESHIIIRDRFVKQVGGTSVIRSCVHTRHNYATVLPGGKILHRKGATPAHSDMLSVIPGSSGSKSFLVEGLGYEPALWSASHGAGRVTSRKKARAAFDQKEFEDYMQEMDIYYEGVKPDETWRAYKDIEKVIAQQEKMVRIEAEMFPSVVFMGGA